jgi:hypothetical protein
MKVKNPLKKYRFEITEEDKFGGFGNESGF